MSNTVIIGASGFLGSYLLNNLSDQFDVSGTYYSNPSKNLIQLDISNEAQVKKFMLANKPSRLFICGGITKTDLCERRKQLASEVNIGGVRNITKHFSGQIVFFSSDYVFDGKSGFYSEKDEPNPINHYGFTKLIGEDLVLSHSDDNVVLRVSGLYGYNEKNNAFVNSFNAPKVYKPVNLYGSTLLLDDIIETLPFFLDRGGLFHLSSENAISRYHFAYNASKILKRPTTVIGKPVREMNYLAPRPKNSTLISVKHDFDITSEKDGLLKVKRHL